MHAESSGFSAAGPAAATSSSAGGAASVQGELACCAGVALSPAVPGAGAAPSAACRGALRNGAPSAGVGSGMQRLVVQRLPGSAAGSGRHGTTPAFVKISGVPSQLHAAAVMAGPFTPSHPMSQWRRRWQWLYRPTWSKALQSRPRQLASAPGRPVRAEHGPGAAAAPSRAGWRSWSAGQRSWAASCRGALLASWAGLAAAGPSPAPSSTWTRCRRRGP